MLHSLLTLVGLYSFWLLLSGIYTGFLMAAGAGCALAVLLFSRRLEIIDREGHPLHLGLPALFSYWPWLAWEIVKSGWDVAWRILHPRLPISPVLTRFKPSQQSTVGLVIHANSITLTPGTIAIEVERNEFLVHALVAASADGLPASEMDRRVTDLETRK